MAETMLTTSDNPFDPFVDFDSWKKFDEDSGYFTLEYLGRIAKTSSDLSEEDQDSAIDEAIDEILEFNVLGIYQKVESKG